MALAGCEERGCLERLYLAAQWLPGLWGRSQPPTYHVAVSAQYLHRVPSCKGVVCLFAAPAMWFAVNVVSAATGGRLKQSRNRFSGSKPSCPGSCALFRVSLFFCSFFLSEYCQQNTEYCIHLKVVFHLTANPDIGEIETQENSQLFLFP